MYTITLNNKNFMLSTYNRQTNIINGKPSVQAQLFLINTENAYDDLLELSETGIQSVEIKNDDTIIYSNPNYNAFITQFDENFISGQIMLNVFLVFSQEELTILRRDSYDPGIQL